MALFSGIVSTFLVPATASSANIFSAFSSFLRLALPPSNVRMVRTITSATASNSPATAEKGKPRGITKPRRVSPEMQAFVGVPEISRSQALKQIWAYIKEKNLQDPDDKKMIVCDEKLKTIFAGKDRVGFLEIAGLMSPHFLK